MTPSAAARETPFGAGRLFLVDSRLAYLFLNDARHRCLHRVFGVSREQANILTAVLLLSGGAVTIDTADRIVHAPIPFTRGDAAGGALLMHEAIGGLVGPAARKVPMFTGLLAFALVGGAALPGLRRFAHATRLAEHRVRLERIRRYVAADRAEHAPAGAA